MIESGIDNMWSKLKFKKLFNKKDFHRINQNDNDNFRAVDIKLISVALTLSSFFLISSVVVFVLEMSFFIIH